MSSEISTDGGPAKAGHYARSARAGHYAAPAHTGRSDRSDTADALQPWQLFTLAGLVGATIVVFLARGQSPAGIILLSCAVFAAAFVGLMALRTFLPLTGAVPDDGPVILGGRTRAALEREKALVLRTIKELEFDRGMGKVSEKDFAEMSARLRARAARLIRQLDAGSVYRQQIEQEVEERVRKMAGSAARAASPGTPRSAAPPAAGTDRADRAEPDTVRREHPPAGAEPGLAAGAVCAACETHNDPDARFCKNCGTRLEPAS